MSANSDFVSPAYGVRAVPINKIVANDWNPNRNVGAEYKLLQDSIREDGFTLPIVCYYHKDKDIYEIVDGFHRFSVMKDCKDIYEREKGCIPVAVIDKPVEERMASTIRHNRARGEHDVDLMSNLVDKLHKLGRSDAWLQKHLGMDKDEILRLKQITGIAELFKTNKFSQAWETQD